MKTILIFSPRVCGELLDNGFEYISKYRDKKNPRFWVYVFEETPELLQVLRKNSRG